MESLRHRVAAIAATLTGFDRDRLDPAVPLVELGFDSLVLTQLAQRLRSEFGVELSFRDFLTSVRTLDAIAGHIGEIAQPEMVEEPARQSEAPPAGPDMPTAPGSELVSVLRSQLDILSRQLDMMEGRGTPKAAEPVRAPSPAATPSRTSSPPSKGPSPTPHEARFTPHQEVHLQRLVAEWNRRTARSKALADEHRPHHADPRSVAGFDSDWKDLVYPLVVDRSEGPVLWDLDGNRYVDLLNGFGPSFFGHSPPFVVEAVRTQLEAGFELGPQTPLAGEAARLICELTGVDRATFTCTGSEAVQAALRAARTFTGRDKVVLFSKAYHGNFDEVLVRGTGAAGTPRTIPASPGVSQRAVDDMIVLEYGADEALEHIRGLGSELAAVLVEPVQTRRPELQPAEFLRELREITRENGTVLIFDEVVTGFRCHLGGAQAIFDVEADLVTYGKVLGGGLPIGVLAGRRPYIDVLDGGPWTYGDDSAPTQGMMFFAGTFVRHPLAIAACHATLRYLMEAGPELQEDLNARTTAMVEELRRIARDGQAPIEIPHFASILFLRPTDPGNAFNSMFFHLMRTHGVHVLEGFPSYLTLSHDDDHVGQIVTGFRKSVESMQEMGFWGGATGAGREPAPMTSSGLGAGDPPPVPGARLGRDRDGSAAWFVEDPDRPGQFVRVG